MAGSSFAQSVYAHSQTQPSTIPNEQGEEFNYELVHFRYFEACQDYFKMPYSITGPWTIKARSHIISSIKANIDVLSLTSSVYNLQADELEKYQIVLEDGDEKLVLTGTSIEVLPYEECFDIFVELHIKTGHGAIDVILKNLENKFLVNDTCLKFFLLHCNLCKSINLQNRKPLVFNDCVNIDILKAPIQDFECRFILFYIDEVTTFSLFRPLITMEQFEISIEMLKIFTDFGPPVVIKTIHGTLFNRVLSILKQGGFDYDISVLPSDKFVGASYYLMQEIVARANSDSAYWSTNCRFVQYKHNNGLLPMRDPILNKVIHTTVKPLNQLFNTKHSTKSEGKLERQTLIPHKQKNAASDVDKSYSVPAIEEYVINLETSETDTASEAEEIRSMHTLEIEDNSISSKQIRSNVIANDKVNMSELISYNPTIDNVDSTEIKIEYNPVQTISLQNSHVSNLETFSAPEIDDAKAVADKTYTPIIVDSIPLKEELVLDEFLCPSTSASAVEASPIPGKETSTANSSKNMPYVETHTAHTNSKKRHTSVKNDDDCCSTCNGKMLTDYFCFGCKKKTHIFCMIRVINPLENITDKVTSFTYCKLCLNAKYNLTNAVKINN